MAKQQQSLKQRLAKLAPNFPSDLLVRYMPEFAVGQDGEFEFIVLDIFGSEFYEKNNHGLQLALVTRDCEQLPFEGYVVPLGSDALQFPHEPLLELQTRAEEGLQIPATLLPTLPGAVPALRVSVKGKELNGDYSRGSTVSISSGILATEHIRSWKSWRLTMEPWRKDIWTAAGLDVDHTDPWHYRRRSTGDTLPFQHISEFKFSKEREEKHALLLTICVLFNYWQRHKIAVADRVLHLEQLSYLYKKPHDNLATWCGEAGCGTLAKSVVVRKLKALQRGAHRYYAKHPEELEDLLYQDNKTCLKLWLPSQKDPDLRARYVAELREIDANENCMQTTREQHFSG